jgi:hypothetical protein
MKRIDDLKHDVQDISDNVLSDLDTEERLQLFIEKAAEDEDEYIQWLTETAPEKEYTATDLEYVDGIKELTTLSLAARHELQGLYQAVNEHEQSRDKYMGLMLLNESLSRLSRGAFDIDEFGNFDAPDHADAEYAYGKTSAPSTAFLATRYRELWEDVPAELLVDEEGREMEQFSNLAAGGLLAYPDDLSAEAFNDLDDDRISSEVYLTEMRLMTALVEFHTKFHGWQIFAEEYVDVSLDELLNIGMPTDDDLDHIHGIGRIDENLGENTLSLKRDYLEAYPSIVNEQADDGEEIDVDLDARAERYAEEIAGHADLAVTSTGGRV